MTFNFNTTQSLRTLDSVYTCLSAWSGKIPSIVCKREEGSSFLSITVVKSDSSTTMKIKEIVAEHTYKMINEITSFGGVELSKRYTLKVSGKDETGTSRLFNVSLSYESEDGKTWSSPDQDVSFS